MKKTPSNDKPNGRERFKAFGRLHFSRNAERTLFFFLTVAMLVIGLLFKMDLI